MGATTARIAVGAGLGYVYGVGWVRVMATTTYNTTPKPNQERTVAALTPTSNTTPKPNQARTVAALTAHSASEDGARARAGAGAGAGVGVGAWARAGARARVGFACNLVDALRLGLRLASPLVPSPSPNPNLSPSPNPKP